MIFRYKPILHGFNQKKIKGGETLNAASYDKMPLKPK